mgnify:FL=1
MHMDIFNDDAFSVVSLTKAIEDTPFVPGRVGQLGIFSEEGVSTTSISIEKVGSTVSLVPAASRGSSGRPMGNDKRQMIPFTATHLPQRASILADEVQNLRAFGSESEVETAQRLMNRKLAKMRRDLDTTIEYQRIGAIKGSILDSDGTTELLNLHTAFGTSVTSHSLVLGTAGTLVRNKVIEARRKMEAALGGLTYSGARVLCSASFFDTLVGHGKVEAAFDRYMNGEFLREDQRGGFYFAGVFWEEYRGQVGATKFIADGEAWMVPEGVPDLFVTNYAPADYMETVNTLGQAYYAKQEPKDFNKGIDVETQSNPIHICTRPAVPVKLLAA